MKLKGKFLSDPCLGKRILAGNFLKYYLNRDSRSKEDKGARNKSNNVE